MFDKSRAEFALMEQAGLRPVLDPGEVILETGLVQAAFIGQDDIETAPGRVAQAIDAAMARVHDIPPVPKGFLAVAGLAAVAVSPGSLVPISIEPDRLLGGRIGAGEIGSVASALKTALQVNGLTNLLVTDRRLAITTDSKVKIPVEGTEREVAVAELLASVPRSLVLGVRRRRRPLEWGRIQLAFVDDSSITVTAGMISGRRADRLVAALAS